MHQRDSAAASTYQPTDAEIARARDLDHLRAAYPGHAIADVLLHAIFKQLSDLKKIITDNLKV